MAIRTPEQAAETVAKILELLAKGGTLVVSNYLKATQADQSHVDAYRKIGKEFLYAKGGSIYMMQGKKAVCISYCRLSVFS